MPIIYQKFISREDLRANPDVYYVFGDNDARVGMGGQAKEMRGEHNAIGIRTKKGPKYHPDQFYYDYDHDENIAKIGQDFEHVEMLLAKGTLVVYPKDGIGTGLARLFATAPGALQFINERESELFEQYAITKAGTHG